MELTDGILLIAASGVGAICGILGQSIKEWLSRPRIKIIAVADEGSSAVLLYFINLGRKSTEDLMIDIVYYDGGIPSGNEKVIFHSTDLTIHPKTAYSMRFGELRDQTLRIRKSDFGKIIKYSDDSDKEQEEWTFRLPVEFYISACAKDERARVKILSLDEKGARLNNPKAISYSMLEQQPASLYKDDEK
jgi:hypothetical protein